MKSSQELRSERDALEARTDLVDPERSHLIAQAQGDMLDAIHAEQDAKIEKLNVRDCFARCFDNPRIVH